MYAAQAVAVKVALAIPAVRKAQHVIAGKPSTFRLAAFEAGEQLAELDPRCSWLRQPDPNRTLQSLLFRTLQDGIWHDRCLWDVERDLADRAVRFRRVHPSRIDTVTDPRDEDTVEAWLVDGKDYTPAQARERFVVFDFGGLGGLRRFGGPLLELYADLQAAAGNYARAPHPKAILKNHGPDLDDDEIDELLNEWEQARATRSVGYLNDAVDYETHGWNPEELQLVEAREHAALEVARLFGLPAKSVDAKSGDPLTYSTLAEWRRDELDAVRPWLSVIEQTLSLDDRGSRPRGLVLPYGITARFLTDEYVRDSALTRMQTWESGLRSGALELDDVKAAEPLAIAPAKPRPAPAPAPAQETPA